jgi:hypothetical protein
MGYGEKDNTRYGVCSLFGSVDVQSTSLGTGTVLSYLRAYPPKDSKLAR